MNIRRIDRIDSSSKFVSRRMDTVSFVASTFVASASGEKVESRFGACAASG
jgi:hypothetical protein